MQHLYLVDDISHSLGSSVALLLLDVNGPFSFWLDNGDQTVESTPVTDQNLCYVRLPSLLPKPHA